MNEIEKRLSKLENTAADRAADRAARIIAKIQAGGPVAERIKELLAIARKRKEDR